MKIMPEVEKKRRDAETQRRTFFAPKEQKKFFFASLRLCASAFFFIFNCSYFSLIASLILLTCSLIAQDKIEVGEVSFDGNKMQLSGDFKWEHSLGKIAAKSATACFNENPWMPYEISLQEGLSLTMPDGGELISPYAWLGCRQWIAIFHGHEGQKITYEKKADNIALKSLRMELNFVPNLVLLERLVAEGQVEIELGKDMQLTSDQAIFDEFSPKGAFGRAELKSGDSSLCHMTQELNQVECKWAEFDLKGNKGVLHEPEGVLQKDGTPLFFKASVMEVDKPAGEIILKPPVTINWMGRLEASGHVEIRKKDILVQGPSKLFWKDPVGNEHRLNVPGILTIYPEQHYLEISYDGTEQIIFSDHYGQIDADKILLTYQEVSGKLEPLKIQFLGNVRIQNNTPGTAQYALADEAFFEFGKSTLTLQSKKRVLFYDELNKVEASAPTLVINRDPKTGQNVMRGIGNVRFVFAEDELNELKKRFSLESRK